MSQLQLRCNCKSKHFRVTDILEKKSIIVCEKDVSSFAVFNRLVKKPVVAIEEII